METKVCFFDHPGPQNTKKILQVIGERLKRGDINKILAASESGRLALQVKQTFPNKEVVCVTYNKHARLKHDKPALMKEKLEEKTVIIVDKVEEPLTRTLTFRNWWEGKTIEMKGEQADLFWMTLICVGGHGFRTCVEIVFMAVEANVVNEGERVISIAGTARGADAAIVVKASRFNDAVGEHPEKRLKIEEILAMPKQTVWSGYG